MSDTIYFDHAATTPLDERVLEEMLPWLREGFGNPSSVHQLGRSAKVALEDARESVAGLLGAERSEVVFTSGGTESNNAAIKGLFDERGERRKRIVTSPVEHNAVIQPVESLRRCGAKPIYVKPETDGRIDTDRVAAAIDEDTALVSMMVVNNELGTINPIEEIAALCREKGVPLHSDGVQGVGKIPIDFSRPGPDLMSLSAHKFGGPKGAGALLVRGGTDWTPWLHGGSQESGRRGGTVNVAGAVGLKKALELAVGKMESTHAHLNGLRTRLLEQLGERFGERLRINGPASGGVPHILNVGFDIDENADFDGEMLLLNLDIEGICISNGSACTSGAVETSHVLAAIGLSRRAAAASLRISLGSSNTLREVELFVDRLAKVLDRMTAVAS